MDNKERYSNREEELGRIQKEYTDKERMDDETGKDRDIPIDLDGDGMIGNTGGFYGGTSYVGSNYGADWNANNTQHEGNYGAAGQQDSTDLTEDNMSRNRDDEEENLTERGE